MGTKTLTIGAKNMNDAQQIFAIFYAIFWGAVHSVLGRWKPFNFGLTFDKQVEHVANRISFAKLILNILPVIYFVLILYIVGLKDNLCTQQKNCLFEFGTLILSGIIPAFGIFGFYRLYIGVVEYDPTKYYKYRHEIPRRYIDEYNDPEPNIRKLGIIQSHKYSWWKNIFFGSAYIILAGLGSLAPDTIFIIVILLCTIYLICKGEYLKVIIIIAISSAFILMLYYLIFCGNIDIVYYWLRGYFPQRLSNPHGAIAKVRTISLGGILNGI